MEYFIKQHWTNGMTLCQGKYLHIPHLSKATQLASRLMENNRSSLTKVEVWDYTGEVVFTVFNVKGQA